MDQHFILFLVGLLWVLITTTILPVNSEEWTMDIEYLNDTISDTTTEPTTTTFTTETPFSPIPGFNIDFENGTIAPWMEASRRSVKWKIENTNSPWESDNAAPTPLNGSSYLRVDRGASLSFGVAILRSPVIIATPGVRSVILSFSFWIRSKWSQYTNLEVYIATDGKEDLFDSLHEYADINNQDWQTLSIPIISTTIGRDFEIQVVFYAYCGTNVEDAVAIDDISLTITDETTTTTDRTPTFTPGETTTVRSTIMTSPTNTSTDAPTTTPTTEEPTTTDENATDWYTNGTEPTTE